MDHGLFQPPRVDTLLTPLTESVIRLAPLASITVTMTSHAKAVPVVQPLVHTIHPMNL